MSATGTLAPVARQQFFDNSGNPLAGGLVYTYLAGTTTPQATYSDAALLTPNANPLVLDAAGRGTLFLSAANYKFIVKTPAGATLYSQDDIAATPYTTLASTFNSVCDGRLTLTTQTPITSADVTAATAVYFTPYAGNRCAIYDGTTWNLLTFTEVSISLGADAADTNYDVFAYSNNGTFAIERLAWTNATTRATALVLQDGVLVKSGDTGRRYLGTYRTTATIGQTEDSLTKRFVWNYRHRVSRTLRRVEGTNSWTYTTATLRQANGAVANKVEVVVGVAGPVLDLAVTAFASNSSAGITTMAAIGEDSTSAVLAGNVGMLGVLHVVNYIFPVSSRISHVPALGYHYYAWLEYSEAAGATTWYGDNGGTFMQTGLIGRIEG